jgi:hypothetical protein
MTCEEVIAGLRALKAEDFADYVPEQLDQLTDAVMELPSPEQAIPELFAVMERFPDSDLGSPGPLVHTLERMNYTDELVASMRRHPTSLAIWMVNRILNTALPPERRHFFLDLLASVAEHPEANESARDDALHFIEFQTAGS